MAEINETKAETKAEVKADKKAKWVNNFLAWGLIAAEFIIIGVIVWIVFG